MQGLIFSASFILVYVYIAVAHRWRGYAVWTGAILASVFCLLFGFDVDITLLFSRINYNVLLIFSGILIIAEVLIETGVPAHLAGRLINIARNYGTAALMICAMSSVISVFVENVATVMIVAPIALEVTKKLKANPVPLLIGIAIASNLQGTATLVGDPPSMILAASENMGFNDFFFMHGKPGIFFAVQIGAIASFFIIHHFIGRDRRKIAISDIPPVTSWGPTIILAAVIAGLAIISLFTSGVGTAAGLICVFGAIASLIWHSVYSHVQLPSVKFRKGLGGNTGKAYRTESRRCREIIRGYDFDTLLLLAGIFFMVAALETFGIMETVGGFIASIAGNSSFTAFLIIVWGSVIFSAFVDNVPFVTAMIPVTHAVAMSLGGEPGSHLYLVFGLLVGSCLGGNISPVGASANIVAVSILRKSGYRVSFLEFVRIGLPFTIVATLAGSAFIWIVWHP